MQILRVIFLTIFVIYSNAEEDNTLELVQVVSTKSVLTLSVLKVLLCKLS